MIGDSLAYTLCYSHPGWPMIVNYTFFLQSKLQNNECLSFRSLAVDNQFCSNLSSGAHAL